MTAVFVVCAAVGGTLLAWQLLMMLLGLGGDHAGGLDGVDAGGCDVSGFHGDGLDPGALHGDAFGHDAGAEVHADSAASPHDAGHHGPSWLAGVLSFRTVVAAVTFFGLSGLTAQAAGATPLDVILVALAGGAAAMYAVCWIMRGLYQLRAEGNVRLERAVGRPARVYLRIPARNAGLGKVQINLQNRTMEYLASTDGEEIPTGAAVTVVGIVSPTTVTVQLRGEPQRSEHV
jgi:hypothetical protein